MKDKVIMVIIVLFFVILLLVLAFSMNQTDDEGYRTDLTVFSGGPDSLYDVIHEIKTESFYRGI